MSLSKEQLKQFKNWIKDYRHKSFKLNIELDKENILKGLIIDPHVLIPGGFASFHLARFLFFNNGLYLNKKVIDMGCGSGIQGIIMGLYGAKKVIFSDIFSKAVENTKKNVKKFKIKNKSIILHGDLFEKIKEKVDVIVFNHPFFPNEPIKNIKVSGAMMDSGKLIHKFFREAKNYLNKNGVIVMPYFHLGGPINNPAIQAPKYKYIVNERLRMNIKYGIKKGLTSIYEIKIS